MYVTNVIVSDSFLTLDYVHISYQKRVYVLGQKFSCLIGEHKIICGCSPE